MRDKATPKQRMKTARLLIVAILALLAISYKLQNADRALRGAKSHEPTLLEKFALSQSN